MVGRKRTDSPGAEHTRPTVPAPPSVRDPRGPRAPVPTTDRDPPELESGVYEAIFTETDLVERLGGLDRVPIVLMAAAQIRALPLDPTAGYLVSQIDGMMTVEMLVDLAPMPRTDVLRTLALLLHHGAIGLQ